MGSRCGRGQAGQLSPLLYHLSLPEELAALGDGAEATAVTTEDRVDTTLTSWPPFVASAHSCYRWEQRLGEGLGPRGVRAARRDAFWDGACRGRS